MSVAMVISVRSKVPQFAWSAHPASLLPRSAQPPALSALPVNTNHRRRRRHVLSAQIVEQARILSTVAAQLTAPVSHAQLADILRYLLVTAWIVSLVSIKIAVSRPAAMIAALADGKTSVVACLAMHVKPVNISHIWVQRAIKRAKSVRR